MKSFSCLHLLTLNRFPTLNWCFHCRIWTSKYWLGYLCYSTDLLLTYCHICLVLNSPHSSMNCTINISYFSILFVYTGRVSSSYAKKFNTHRIIMLCPFLLSMFLFCFTKVVLTCFIIWRWLHCFKVSFCTTYMLLQDPLLNYILKYVSVNTKILNNRSIWPNCWMFVVGLNVVAVS